MPFKFNPFTDKLDLVDVTAIPPGAVATLTGNSGGAVPPTGNNINTVGTGSITVVGNPGTSTLTAQLTGLTNHSLLVGAGTATITNLGVATNGQLPIGSSGADPVLSTLTAGDGITITNGAGSITIAAENGLSGTGTTVGATTADIITFALGATPASYIFEFVITGFDGVTPSATGYWFIATVRTDGATATVIGSTEDFNEDSGLVSSDVDMVGSGGSVILRVTGVAGVTLNWTASGRYVRSI